jgi:hypothetical protein
MCTWWKPGKQIYRPRNLWVSNREYSLVERKAELDICTVAAQEGQRIAPQSWDTVECISYITASWPSIHRSGFYSFTLELQSSTERFTTKIGILNISPRVIDWYALHQHTISVHERLVERDDVIFDSRTVRATDRNAGWTF